MHPQVLPRFKMKTARTLLELIHVSGEFLCLHAGHICDQNHYVIELSVSSFRMPISRNALRDSFQISHQCSLGLKDELIGIWWTRFKG